ncbi:MAG: DNA repair protein RadA [Limnochordia bacterium]|jgi:DNA repair protein RadA/Sms
MAKARKHYVCQECGHKTWKWLGRCPGCGQWNSLVEEMEPKISPKTPWSPGGISSPAQSIDQIEPRGEDRYPTRLHEFDRVLGGGIVPGSLILVGGDPGIGKSTLLLQVSRLVAQQEGEVLYISGEESPQQLRLRAQRLGALHPQLLVLAETNVHNIQEQINGIKPNMVVVDSIQTMFRPELDSTPGSVSQVRETAGLLLHMAKASQIPIILVGHVTKAGALAGPRVLEHMVDVVCYFEGDQHAYLRILRATKNRFGSTNEVGVFQMGSRGLEEIADPSSIFLAGRPRDVSGSVVFPCCEGSRVLLLELQALVGPAPFGGPPRRLATGLDHNRVNMLLAVLEKRCGLALQSQDVYFNVAGGLKISEPAADLGAALAIASSFRNREVAFGTLAFGEVGLAGEVRMVNRADLRLKEGLRLGFDKFLIPQGNAEELKDQIEMRGVAIIPVRSLQEALDYALQ